MDTYRNTVIQEVAKLAQLNKLDSATNTRVVGLINSVLNTTVYGSVQYGFNQLVPANGNVSASVIPSLVMSVIQLKGTMEKLLGQTVPQTDMEYVVYALLYYFLIKDQSQFFNDNMSVENFRNYYNGLWALIELNPSALESAEDEGKTSCFC